MTSDYGGLLFWGLLLALTLAMSVWLYFLGGPCTGAAAEVPAWCVA